MRARLLLFMAFTISLISLGLLVTVLFNSPPSDKNIIALFYTAFTISVCGIMFFAIYLSYLLRNGTMMAWRQTIISLQIALTITLMLSGSLALKANGLFSWLTVLVLALVLITANILTRKRIIIR